MSKIEIYSRASCQYCYAAKRLLALHGLEYEEYSLDAAPELMQEMLDRTGNRTVPQILVDGEPKGGFQELSELNRQGWLAALAGSG